MELELALKEQEARVDDLLKATNKYTGALKSWKKACALGQVNAMQKTAQQARELAPALAQPTEEAASAWEFDVRDYLESGAWRRDVQEAGEKQGLRIIPEGDNLVSSPVVVRAVPGRAILQLGKAGWPSLRPNLVALELKRLRDRAASANSQEFAEGMFAAMQRLNKETPDNGFVKFRDVYDLFSITPGWKRDNSPAAFGQAIYALHRSGLNMTRAGRRFDFVTPSGSVKERDIYSVIAEDGHNLRYYGIEFR